MSTSTPVSSLTPLTFGKVRIQTPGTRSYLITAIIARPMLTILTAWLQVQKFILGGGHIERQVGQLFLKSMNNFTLVLKRGAPKHSSSNHRGSLFSNTASPEHLHLIIQ